MYRFTYPAEAFDEENISKKEIHNLIIKHRSMVSKIRKNKDYYNGKHSITDRTRVSGAPNEKVVCNHAKDISDTAAGYFMGNPITYENTSKESIEPLLIAFDKAQIDDTDSDLALDLSICGIAYEYLYIKEGETVVNSKTLDATNCFVVCDDTIEENELFGVYYWRQKDDKSNQYRIKATIMTKSYIYDLTILGSKKSAVYDESEKRAHFFNDIPLIEYLNNKYGIGDFEQQIPLIDAYNTLMSDRINDKEQFIDALLVLYGTSLADDADEANEAAKVLRQNKLLELPEGAKAEYLLRSLDETGVEILRKAIKEDIYTFSHVPNLTDENFSGNTSGVAMEFKLLGLEMVTKIKTRYYKVGLRKRIKLFCNYLGLKNISLEADSITASFARTLPKNLLELSQVINNLKGTVSTKSLVRLIPFVEDPDDEMKKMAEEESEKAKNELLAYSNLPDKELTDGEGA